MAKIKIVVAIDGISRQWLLMIGRWGTTPTIVSVVVCECNTIDPPPHLDRDVAPME